MYEEIMKRYMVSGAEVDTERANIYTLCKRTRPNEHLESQYTGVCEWDWCSVDSNARHFSLYGMLLEVMTAADYVNAVQKPSAKLSSDANYKRVTSCTVHPSGARGAPTNIVFTTEGDKSNVVLHLIGANIEGKDVIALIPVKMATRVSYSLNKKERALVADMFGIALLFFMSGKRTIKQVKRWLKQQHKICKHSIGGTVLQVNKLCRALGDDEQLGALLDRLTFWDESVCGNGFSVYMLKAIEDDMNESNSHG